MTNRLAKVPFEWQKCHSDGKCSDQGLRPWTPQNEEKDQESRIKRRGAQAKAGVVVTERGREPVAVSGPQGARGVVPGAAPEQPDVLPTFLHLFDRIDRSESLFPASRVARMMTDRENDEDAFAHELVEYSVGEAW